MHWSYIIVASIALLTLISSCKKDSVGTSSTPRNLFTGVADGANFSNSTLVVLKDSLDNFLLVGSLAENSSILAAFRGRSEREYDIATTGALPSLSSYLDQLISVDSFVVDTMVLQEIFADSAQLLPDGSSFIFVTHQEEAFFSTRGTLTLSLFDPTINRIYGTIEAEYTNANSGPKYINGVFEDVYFFDCASFEDCAF